MKSSKGFTLIELVVVMAVFLLIIGTAIAIFISIVQHQKRILAQQELLNQTSYFIEYMTKGLRMAKKEMLADDCIGEGYVYQLTHFGSGKWKGIKFINQSDADLLHPDGACQEFYLDDSNPESPVIKERKNGGFPTNVTSTNLRINSLNFSLNGVIPGQGDDHVPTDSDTTQPRVIISLDVKIQGDNNQPAIKIQTTVSQRDLNK